MSGRRVGIAAMVVSVAASFASPSSAAPPTSPPAAAPDATTAAESFHQGSVAYGKRDYRNAAAAFERAYRIAPHGSALFNAGLAWEAAKEPARAADAHEGALAAGGLTPGQTRAAQARLTALETELGRLEVTGPGGAVISVAHADRIPVPANVHLEPGEYDVRASFEDGTTTTEHVVITAGAKAPLAVAPPPPPPPEPPPPVAVAAPPPPPPRDGAKQRLVGWAAIGGGAVLAIAGGYVGVRALGARDDFNASAHTDAAAHDRAASGRTWSTVLLVGAAVIGGAGIALVLTAPRGDAPKASVALIPGGASLHVSY